MKKIDRTTIATTMLACLATISTMHGMEHIERPSLMRRQLGDPMPRHDNPRIREFPAQDMPVAEGADDTHEQITRLLHAIGEQQQAFGTVDPQFSTLVSGLFLPMLLILPTTILTASCPPPLNMLGATLTTASSTFMWVITWRQMTSPYGIDPIAHEVARYHDVPHAVYEQPSNPTYTLAELTQLRGRLKNLQDELAWRRSWRSMNGLDALVSCACLQRGNLDEEIATLHRREQRIASELERRQPQPPQALETARME